MRERGEYRGEATSSRGRRRGESRGEERRGGEKRRGRVMTIEDNKGDGGGSSTRVGDDRWAAQYASLH